MITWDRARGKQIEKTVAKLLESGAWKATMFLSPIEIVRATRRRYHKGKVFGSATEVLVTIGRPNYKEREFVALCKKAKELFPIKDVQLKFVPEKR